MVLEEAWADILVVANLALAASHGPRDLHPSATISQDTGQACSHRFVELGKSESQHNLRSTASYFLILIFVIVLAELYTVSPM